MENIKEDVKLSTLAKLGAGYLALGQLAKLFKLQKQPIYNRNVTKDYANQLANSKTDVEALTAVVGLLNVCATLLLRIDKLRFLGSKIMAVVKSEELRKYIEENG